MIDFLVALQATKQARLYAQVIPPEVPITLTAIGLLTNNPSEDIPGDLINQRVLTIRGINHYFFLSKLQFFKRLDLFNLKSVWFFYFCLFFVFD